MADDVVIRARTETDERAIEQLYRELSPDSSYTRFFCAGADAYKRATRGNGERVVMVAEVGGKIVAVGEYCRSTSNSERAEVAFAVLDAFQHHGLGTRLLQALRATARERGVRELTAQVLGTNAAMMNVFRHSGLQYRSRFRGGVYDVVLGLDDAKRAG